MNISRKGIVLIIASAAIFFLLGWGYPARASILQKNYLDAILNFYINLIFVSDLPSVLVFFSNFIWAITGANNSILIVHGFSILALILLIIGIYYLYKER